MSDFSVTLRHVAGYRFEVDFGVPTGVPLVTDLPEPTGTNRGPNPEHLLAAAAANCLSATLLFTLNKMKVPFDGLTATVTGTVVKNERNRSRVGSLHVRLELSSPASPDEIARADRLFRDYCTVTESLKTGVAVTTELVPAPALAGL